MSVGDLGGPLWSGDVTARSPLVAYQGAYERNSLFSDPSAYEGASLAYPKVDEIADVQSLIEEGRRGPGVGTFRSGDGEDMPGGGGSIRQEFRPLSPGRSLTCTGTCSSTTTSSQR